MTLDRLSQLPPQGQYSVLLSFRDALFKGKLDEVRQSLEELLQLESPAPVPLRESVPRGGHPVFGGHGQMADDDLPTMILQAQSASSEALADDTVIHVPPALESDTILQGAGQQALPVFDVQDHIRETLMEIMPLERVDEASYVFDQYLLHPFEAKHTDLVVKALQQALQEQLGGEVSLLGEGAMGWVFLGKIEGQLRVVKVPKLHVSEHSSRLYEHEIMFFENHVNHFGSHGEQPWYPRYYGEGRLHFSGRNFHYGIFEYYLGPQRITADGRETNAVMSLQELIQTLPQVHPGVSLLLVEHMLMALLDFQSIMSGIIHRDLKPENYFVNTDLAKKLWEYVQVPLEQRSPAALKALWKNMLSTQRRMLTNDFGLVLEMVPNCSPEPLCDENGEVLVGLTKRYANMNAIIKYGTYAHSDRYSIACILYEMITGQVAQTGREMSRIHFEVPEGFTGLQQEVLQLVVTVLNDDREHQLHNDNVKEEQITQEFLSAVRTLLKKAQKEIHPGLTGRLRKETQRFFKGLLGQ